MQLPLTVLEGIEQALNHYLSLDPRTLAQMADLEGQKTQQGIMLTFGITSQRGGDKGPRGCCLFNF